MDRAVEDSIREVLWVSPHDDVYTHCYPNISHLKVSKMRACCLQLLNSYPDGLDCTACGATPYYHVRLRCVFGSRTYNYGRPYVPWSAMGQFVQFLSVLD